MRSQEVLTSLSWLLASVSRVTGLPGVLLSLTGGMCPLRMTGTVPRDWPRWGWATGWAWLASLLPKVRYCLTCWAWVWWRWYLEFSRWFWTFKRREKTYLSINDVFMRKCLSYHFFPPTSVQPKPARKKQYFTKMCTYNKYINTYSI